MKTITISLSSIAVTRLEAIRTSREEFAKEEFAKGSKAVGPSVSFESIAVEALEAGANSLLHQELCAEQNRAMAAVSFPHLEGAPLLPMPPRRR